MKKQNDKKGFTIIEVMLVIAIAGLIFMLVFLALPALQRSRRDQQRKTDMSRITSALENYKSNNRGAIPTVGKYVQGRETPLSNAISPDYTKSWDYFYDAYVIVNSAGAKDVFADPSGSPYSLAIQSCKTTGIKPGDDCTVGQRYNVSFDEQSIGTPEEALSAGTTGGTIGNNVSILTNATCQGEIAKYNANAHSVAVLYKNEGGGVICLNN